MSKRFTSTEKWNDPWFMALSPTAKHLWQYLLDHCDNAGVVEPNIKLASFQIGEPIEPNHFTELGDRLETLPNGKLWIRKFIRFQFGELSNGSLVHQSVMRVIQSHNIPYPMPMPSDSQVIARRCQSPKAKENDKEKEGGVGETSRRGFQKPTIPELQLHCAKIGLPESEAEGFFHYHESRGWVVGRQPMKSWVSAMATWKGNYEKFNRQSPNGASHNETREEENARILREAL